MAVQEDRRRGGDVTGSVEQGRGGAEGQVELDCDEDIDAVECTVLKP